ncbi:MAG: prepilin-type N-terminal cleavage/methylation domain-containing protein, partial [Burkholderiales bacterium]
MYNTPTLREARRGRSRGVSLVELLVAAAIGIIASLAIFQVFAVFEGQK